MWRVKMITKFKTNRYGLLLQKLTRKGQSLEDTQVGYISQKYTLDKYTLERASPPVHHPLCITLNASPPVHHPQRITPGASPPENHPRCIIPRESPPVHHPQ